MHPRLVHSQRLVQQVVLHGRQTCVHGGLERAGHALPTVGCLGKLSSSSGSQAAGIITARYASPPGTPDHRALPRPTCITKPHLHHKADAPLQRLGERLAVELGAALHAQPLLRPPACAHRGAAGFQFSQRVSRTALTAICLHTNQIWQETLPCAHVKLSQLPASGDKPSALCQRTADGQQCGLATAAGACRGHAEGWAKQQQRALAQGLSWRLSSSAGHLVTGSLLAGTSACKGTPPLLQLRLPAGRLLAHP